MMIDVLLVDNRPSFVVGTRVLLEQEPDMKVYDASSSDQAIQLTAGQPFEVILVDLQMPGSNGFELAKQLLSAAPDTALLIYTGLDVRHCFNRMVELGIAGFVSQTAGQEQLATAVRCAVRGESVLPVSLMRQLRWPASPSQDKRGQELCMTDRELHILRHIARGRSNREISNALHTSQRSLEYTLTDLFHKLHVKSRVEAVVKAKELGILDDAELLLCVR